MRRSKYMGAGQCGVASTFVRLRPDALALTEIACTPRFPSPWSVEVTVKRDLEAARYATDRAFRQYDAADPANRLVTGELEGRWNKALARVAEVEGKIASHDAAEVAPATDPASLATLGRRSQDRLERPFD